MFHHTRQSQVHQIVSADLVAVAVRQRPQTAGFGLAMQSSLAVFVSLHCLDFRHGSAICMRLSI
jgi:hypothetical protein